MFLTQRHHFAVLLCTVLATLPAGAFALEPGTPLAPGVFPAVGKVRGCTATLIEDRRVLTAAHCVCPGDRPGNCVTRANFEFVDIQLASAPGRWMNVKIPGTVRVHPEFGLKRWLSEDLAVVDLDIPASQAAPGIAPIPVENPIWVPPPGTSLRLVGFGHSRTDCKGPAQKRMLDVVLTTSQSARLMIQEPGKRNCPGDSGGPMLNSAGRVAGVMSWTGKEINGRPTHANFNFIFNLPRPGWSGCSWVKVGPQRSHGAGAAWCPNGSFLTQFDLEGDKSFSAHEAPVVGKARCCRLAQYYSPWGGCRWAPVGVDRSFQPGWSWCADGEFLVALDLDVAHHLPAAASPVVGQALCCRAQSGPAARWGSTYLEDVGGQKSHQAGAAWCPAGSFLTRFELAGPAGYHSHDTPFVSRATCVRPRQ